jgi:hypothetical protein
VRAESMRCLIELTFQVAMRMDLRTGRRVHVMQATTGFPDAVQRDSGAPLIRDLHRLGACDDPRVCNAPLRAALLRPGHS